ncbi:hypothetical protein SAMN02910265_01012 [Ruminococcus flavefaciens]|uniref:Uncharacterized protein n=1 Tax=Ruminococcus flavefaciens TaxID=1265 RepID=A0A1M7IH57_RUMFL|nr:hypothetical protein SAMN02910265_01012 [Ruminococcus flavefaciens]SHM39995.1 hypothetical protein SAMN04487860_104112 [Ruminococcus flavefaciens]
MNLCLHGIIIIFVLFLFHIIAKDIGRYCLMSYSLIIISIFILLLTDKLIYDMSTLLIRL